MQIFSWRSGNGMKPTVPSSTLHIAQPYQFPSSGFY